MHPRSVEDQVTAKFVNAEEMAEAAALKLK